MGFSLYPFYHFKFIFMKSIYFFVLLLALVFVGCNNAELDNMVQDESSTMSRSLDNNVSTTSTLPNVQVSCINHCTAPIVVTFTAPNYAQIGNANPYTSSKTITPLFVYNDQFAVRATIQHGCSSNHTLKITNTWGYEEVLVSGDQIGTYEYSGYIPLSHQSLERISVQLY